MTKIKRMKKRYIGIGATLACCTIASLSLGLVNSLQHQSQTFVSDVTTTDSKDTTDNKLSVEKYTPVLASQHTLPSISNYGFFGIQNDNSRITFTTFDGVLR